MKKLFIPAVSDLKIDIPESLKEKLKCKRIGLITTVQYLVRLEEIKEQIFGSIIGGQILGCDCTSALQINEQVEIYLYIGSGRFHPLKVAYSTKKEVICLNPLTKEISTITQEEIDLFEKKKTAKKALFLSADRVGILITTKTGQEKMKEAVDLKKWIESTGKKAYLFLADTFNPSDFENYKEIQCLVNTACPRIEEDHYPRPIIDIEDVLKINL